MISYTDFAFSITIDGALFCYFCWEYYKHRKLIHLFLEAQESGINPDLERVKKENGKELFAVVQGNVKALSTPIRSVNSPLSTAVIQKLTIKEHSITRSSPGFWSDKSTVIDESYNTVPFELNKDEYHVEIVGPLESEYLVLDVVDDRYEPSLTNYISSLFDYIVGFRRKGLQYSEHLLKEGTQITGFGMIKVKEQNKLLLEPPCNGVKYILSTLQPNLLLRKIEHDKLFYKWVSVILGSCGVLLTYLMIRKWWTDRKQKQVNDHIRYQRLKASHQQNDGTIPEAICCVVCCMNPREVILLTCGHVCVCVDCCESLNDLCPICRRKITEIRPAFIS